MTDQERSEVGCFGWVTIEDLHAELSDPKWMRRSHLAPRVPEFNPDNVHDAAWSE